MMITEELLKGRVEQAAIKVVREYEAKPYVTTRWKTPLIGYASTSSDAFAKLYSEGKIKHPKEIYRPGATIVSFFLPVDDEKINCNLNGANIPAAFETAFKDSIFLSAMMNDAIIEVFEILGRETSLTCTVAEESEEVPWSHKLAAYAAGLGTFEKGELDIFDQLVTQEGKGGRFGSILTELPLESLQD